MSRLDNIAKFAQKQQEEKVSKEMEKLNRIENYKAQIIALKPRIDELIAVGNACINNNIQIGCDEFGGRQSYDNNYFMTNGWSHLLGFVKNYEKGKIKPITQIGILGGGYCHYDLRTDGITIDVSGSDTEYVLKRFVDEFDKFENAFYKYVDSITLEGR